MKIFISLIAAIALTGCSQQSSDSTDAAKKPLSATKQVIERSTGKTAVKSFQHTKDVLGDVEKSTKARAQNVKDMK